MHANGTGSDAATPLHMLGNKYQDTLPISIIITNLNKMTK